MLFLAYRPTPEFPQEQIGDTCRTRKSPRLEARESNDLGPFFSFLGDELAELCGRTCKHGAAQVGKSRFHFGIGEGRVDFLVKRLDDVAGRIRGCADPMPTAR